MNFKDLKQELDIYPCDKIVFVGIGNPTRGDDSAGLLLTDQIAGSCSFPEAHFIKAYTTPENHLQEILDYQPKLVVIIDSANWGGQAGEISWIDNQDIDNISISTHSYSISLIEKYLKLNSCTKVKYLVIQHACLDFSDFPSSQIDNSIEKFFM